MKDMIDAQDLCIGNWVYDGECTRFPMFIRTIGEDYVCLDFPQNEGDLWESTLKELRGIPITEELLTKLGFTPNGYGLWNKVQQCRRVAINIEREFVAIDAYKDKLCDSRCTCHGIKFLHQLQNLFWTISKEQLKLDL